MQRYTTVKVDADEDDVALALVVDAELFRIEAAVRWLDTADARLRRRPVAAKAPAVQPTPPRKAPVGRLGVRS
jgi:hypothetical protein